MSWESIFYWIEHHPGAASWVQAVGAIASIWAAFLIGNKQLRKQNQIRDEEKRARLHSFYAVVKSAAHNVSTFGSLLSSGNSLPAVEENWKLIFAPLFKTSQRAIGNLPSHELGNYELVESFHSLAGSIDLIITAVERGLQSDAFADQEFAYMREEVLVQCRVCDLSWKRFELACKDLNHSWKLPEHLRSVVKRHAP